MLNIFKQAYMGGTLSNKNYVQDETRRINSRNTCYNQFGKCHDPDYFQNTENEDIKTITLPLGSYGMNRFYHFEGKI